MSLATLIPFLYLGLAGYFLLRAVVDGRATRPRVSLPSRTFWILALLFSAPFAQIVLRRYESTGFALDPFLLILAILSLIILITLWRRQRWWITVEGLGRQDLQIALQVLLRQQGVVFDIRPDGLSLPQQRVVLTLEGKPQGHTTTIQVHGTKDQRFLTELADGLRAYIQQYAVARQPGGVWLTLLAALAALFLAAQSR